MKKTRFLWVRDLPNKCRDNELRDVFGRHGNIQNVRLFKDGHSRQAIIAFVDVKSAMQAVNACNNFHGSTLKVEYCDSLDSLGINFELLEHPPKFPNDCKDTSSKRSTSKGSREHTQPSDTKEAPTQALKCSNGRPVVASRFTQNPSVSCDSASWRGLKLSNLPPLSKLTDEHLRQGLFTEFRRCGRIQLIVLPNTSVSNGPSESGRVAIVTFRRPEEAERAYQAIRSGEKLLFSTLVLAELHPGFTSPEDHPSKTTSSTGVKVLNESGQNGCAINTGTASSNFRSPSEQMLKSDAATRSPTRTLYVSGLTTGPTGPVTPAQLTTAFRKFGDIIDVQLQTSSNSALIQFAEMRGPIRAMSAHSRDPLRLGGRPLFLAYVPSPPSTGLWFSDLPNSLASLRDTALLHRLSQVVPVQQITLINRFDPSGHSQPSCASTKSNGQCNYAAYILLASPEHASRLLSDLRSGKHFEEDAPLNPNFATTPPKQSPRRLVAVDFASQRQTTLVNSLKLNAARSGASNRIRVISATTVEGSACNPHHQFTDSSVTTSCSQYTSAKVSAVVSNDRRPNARLDPSSTNRPSQQQAIATVPNESRAVPAKHSSCSSSVSGRAHIAPHKTSKSTYSEDAKQNQCRLTAASGIAMLQLKQVDRARNSSPSSLSTCSSSSSLSSESTSSSSSSSSSSTSSSVSSTTSSGSSARSRSHRVLPSPSTKCRFARSRTADVTKVSRRSRAIGSSHPLNVPRPSSTITRKMLSASSEQSVLSENTEVSDLPWTGSAVKNSTFTQRPLSVVTSITATALSPTRSSAASSGGLSSPGLPSVTISTGLPSNPVRKSNGIDGLSGHQLRPSTTSHTPGLTTSHTPSTTTLLNGEFRVNPAVSIVSSSASSGVSSGSRSFSSTSSNSSNGGSPSNDSHAKSSHSALGPKQPITVIHSYHAQSKPCSSLTTTAPSSTKETSTLPACAITSQSNVARPKTSGPSGRKSRLYCTEVSSGLKLHLSTNCPASQSPGSFSSPPTATPLTVSIKLGNSGMPSQSAIVASPSDLSTHSESFRPTERRRTNESLPSTPCSAPPLNCTLKQTPSEEVGCDKLTLDYPSGGMSTHSTDWFTFGSPVYESMYDKIKRRTNKEAEERRRRQLEASTVREKKRRKQLKKEVHLAKSPPLNSLPYTPPESFGSEHSIKTAMTNSSSRSYRSKSGHLKLTDSIKLDDVRVKVPHNRMREDGVVSCRSSTWRPSKHLDRTWPQLLNSTHPQELSHPSPTKLAHKVKRRRRDLSSTSSSLSSNDERRSASPPGTLTRLSLGMRFPVSATYHECVRPLKGSSHSKWSAEEDDESIGHSSSSLSCPSSDKSDRYTRGKKSRQSCTYPRTERFQTCNDQFKITTVATHSSVNLGAYGRNFSRALAAHPELKDVRNSCRLSESGTHDTCSVVPKRSINDSFSTELSFNDKHKLADSEERKAQAMNDHKFQLSCGAKRRHDDENLHSRKKQRTLFDCTYEQHISRGTRLSHLKKVYEQRARSPQSCFSDEANVLDFDSDYIKCSAPGSRGTTTAEFNGIKWSRGCRSRRTSTGLHSGTDDSSLPVTRSPSPVHCRSPFYLVNRQIKRNCILGSSVCDDSVGKIEDDRDSVFDVFPDSDRFSTNSKSTPSTEPMEQSDFNERSFCTKFSDDEWHSSVASSSPHPTNIDFDVDFCPIDKTEQSSTTYQSTSFSSQLLSPAGKLVSPVPDDSDDDPLNIGRDVKLFVAMKKDQEVDSIICTPVLDHSSAVRSSFFETSFIPQDQIEQLTREPAGPPTVDPSNSNGAAGNLSPSLNVQVKTSPNPHVPSIVVHTTSVLESTTVKLPDVTEVCAIPTTFTKQESAPNDCVVITSAQSHHAFDSSSLCVMSPTITSAVSTLCSCNPLVNAVSESTCSSSFASVHPEPVGEQLDPVSLINKPELESSSELSQVSTSTPSSTSTFACTSAVSSQTTDVEIKSFNNGDKMKVDVPSNPTSLHLPSPSSNTIRKSHAAPSDSIKGLPIISPPPNGPPSDAHDITRYVQSVIERVKAERVEETQQAVAAAAHYHPATSHQSSSSTSSAVSTISGSRSFDVMHVVTHSLGAAAVTNKRSTNGQRKPLLVTTSACSSTKCSGINTSSRGSVVSSSISMHLPVASSSNNDTSSGPILSPLSSSAGHSNSQLLTATSTSSDLQVPTIPGVNACAPLTVSVSQSVSGRLTRQSLQHAQPNALQSGKRLDVPTSVETSGAINSRKRRRSEGKSISFCVTNKDVPTVQCSPLISTSAESTHSTSKFLSTCLASPITPIINKPHSRLDDAIGDAVHQANCIVGGTFSTCPASSAPKSHTSVDPYEPNFDEESPPGFDHSQLHHHRSTTPVSSSPSQQPSVCGTRKALNTSPISTCTTSPAIPNIGSIPVASSCLVTSVHTTSIASADSLTDTRTVPVSTTADSVDEVIRDVLSGQFDMQSYLCNYRAEPTTSLPRISKDSPNSKISLTPMTSTSTTPIAVPVCTLAPKSVSVAGSISTATPFPLSLASEPVVAAVTIPVSSNTTGANKPTIIGKNGSSSVVSIGTGNALLNTLLAALQLIPGSQVTVTGPTAASGVVGGIGTGTISATTITLPVNAARQAAANIKAAMLSATNAMSMVNTDAVPQTVANDCKVSAKLQSSEMQTTAAVTACGSATTSKPPLVSYAISQVSTTSLTQSQQRSLTQTVTIPRQTTTTVAQASGTGARVRRSSGLLLKKTVLLPKSADPSFVSTTVGNVHLSEPSTTISLQQLKTPPLDRLSGQITAARTSVTTTSIQGSLSGLPTANLSSTFSGASHSSNVCLPVVSQSHGPGNTAPPFVQLTSPTPDTTLPQPLYGRPSARAAAPLLSGRSPPIAAPQLNNHTMQTLIDRLSGAVEPSVLIALAQAAVGGTGLNSGGGVSDPGHSETETQVANYLRLLAHQLTDTRLCNGPAAKHVGSNVSLSDVHGKVTMHATATSPPNNPVFAQPNQQSQRAPQSATSSMYINTLSPDVNLVTAAAVSRPCSNADTNALISPPVVPPPRSIPPQSAGVTSLNPISWNSLSHTYPLVWQGRLSLKNAETRVALHYIYGNPNLLHDCMRLLASGGGGQSQHSLVASGGPLRIVQRMRLEPAQLEGVQRKIHQDGASCVCLALPAGSGPVELMKQTQILNDSFIRYMQEKVAAGIINVGIPDFQQVRSLCGPYFPTVRVLTCSTKSCRSGTASSCSASQSITLVGRDYDSLIQMTGASSISSPAVRSQLIDYSPRVLTQLHAVRSLTSN
ncbi:SPOC domain protein [Paragonimus heterotremus]|uniref:SPOC domain protein n=1 Tax=Paragonimus heterotremus TaxID=100268 RepID=A0A8J4TDX1_9TREM|nr:SPOC domain protein [Paragonimus heterotremus]